MHITALEIISIILPIQWYIVIDHHYADFAYKQPAVGQILSTLITSRKENKCLIFVPDKSALVPTHHD